MATAGARPRPTAGARTPAQTFALVFGAIYLLVGIVGFAFTGFNNFASASEDKLIFFRINPLHNIVHIAIGAVWIYSASTHATAKLVNLIVGIVLLVVALIGFIETPDKVLEWLSIDGATSADNFLHLITGAAGVFFGTVGAEGTTVGTAPSP